MADRLFHSWCHIDDSILKLKSSYQKPNSTSLKPHVSLHKKKSLLPDIKEEQDESDDGVIDQENNEPISHVKSVKGFIKQRISKIPSLEK